MQTKVHEVCCVRCHKSKTNAWANNTNTEMRSEISTDIHSDLYNSSLSSQHSELSRGPFLVICQHLKDNSPWLTWATCPTSKASLSMIFLENLSMVASWRLRVKHHIPRVGVWPPKQDVNIFRISVEAVHRGLSPRGYTIARYLLVLANAMAFFKLLAKARQLSTSVAIAVGLQKDRGQKGSSSPTRTHRVQIHPNTSWVQIDQIESK